MSVTVMHVEIKPHAHVSRELWCVVQEKFLAVEPGMYRLEDAAVDQWGFLSGFNHHIHPTERIFIEIKHYTIRQRYCEPHPLPPTDTARCRDRKPLRCLINQGDRAEVAEARRRVAMKRFLWRNGCKLCPETPSHILRTITKRLRAAL